MPDLSQLPSVERLAVALAGEVPLPRPLVIGYLKRSLESWRVRMIEGEDVKREDIEADVRSGLRTFASSRLQPVINGTGVLIHTNLGRSPLGDRAADALRAIATGYSNLEFNLLDGKRGQRAGYLETALAVLLETEAATAVNNCAAALVLSLRTVISEEKNEVIVSRGELVEIGGGFRIPDVLETSGAQLVEVGATNKTHLVDYAKAITERTALILKVHRSNFYLGGFTAEPTILELSALAREHDLPLIEDLGSGAVMATDELAPIDHEPTPQEALRNGIDLITFSGDKLLGGPQAGIIAGRADMVAACAEHPLARALRPGSLVLHALQDLALAYLARDGDAIPFWRMASTRVDVLRTRALAIRPDLVVDTVSVPGGGTLPGVEIPSVGLSLPGDRVGELRAGNPPVIARVTEGSTILDLRTVHPNDDAVVAAAVATLTG